MTSLILRALRWPEDRGSLQRIDTSFVAQTIYVVNSESRSFSLIECASSPVRKNYAVEWSELATADAAIIAQFDEDVIGIGVLRYSTWNRRATIAHLYVDSAARGQGVGASLLQELRVRARALGARSLFVETQNVNVPAIRFYERNGFGLVGLDMAMYDPKEFPGETALFFEQRCDRETITSAP